MASEYAGHIQIPNDMFEAWCAIGSREERIFKAIIRETFGWADRRAAGVPVVITAERFGELTGISDRGKISVITSHLVAQGRIIKVTQWGRTSAYWPCDVENWLPECLDDTEGDTKNGSTTEYGSTTKNGITGDTKNGNGSATKNGSTPSLYKENSQRKSKESTHDSAPPRFHPLAKEFARLFHARAPSIPENKAAFQLEAEIPNYNDGAALTVITLWAQQQWDTWRSSHPEPAPQIGWFRQKIIDFIETGKLPGVPPQTEGGRNATNKRGYRKSNHSGYGK